MDLPSLSAIKTEKDDMDISLAEQDIIEAGRALVERHPEIGAIVLECTNMPPYAAALRACLLYTSDAADE